MVSELCADVSSAQQGAVVQEVGVCPLAQAPGLLPGMPGVQPGHQIAFTHCKPAQPCSVGHLETLAEAFESKQSTPMNL